MMAIPKHIFWPNSNGVFIVSLLTLIFAGNVFNAALAIGLLVCLTYIRRIQIAEHFITALEVPGTSLETIIQKKDARVIEGRRLFGSCLIIDDRRSEQEIVIYKWMFNAMTLKRMREMIEGA